MASSEINTILANSLSADANLRKPAEQALSQAAESNFSLYLETLCRELANEEAQGFIRQAAGIALKNGFTSRDFNRQQAVKLKWLRDTDPDTKARVKGLVLQTLSSMSAVAGQAAAQVVAAIAAIELPRNEWPDLMDMLVQAVNNGADHQKQASLTTIGFICETSDAELRASLSSQSNAILTAVVAGARHEQPNAEIRVAAVTALGDSLEFVSENFKNEGERNYIMQVVCEATQAEDSRIRQGAFGCLNRIMGLYYDHMCFYMEKALFGLTVQGMKNEDEDVAKLAVEFWSTVCEEELDIEEENSLVEGAGEMRPMFNFARIAYGQVVPEILQLLTKQEEDATDDEYNLSRAAYQCLCLYSQAVGNPIVPEIVRFTEANIRSEDWRCRDAAVSAFGAMMEGPDDNELLPIVKQALPTLVEMMVTDPSVQVKDSVAYALGRITEHCPGAIDPASMMEHLIRSLFSGLLTNPKMAASCCWALINLVDRFSNYGEGAEERNFIAPHFNASITSLLEVTGNRNCENSVRTAAYEVLCSLVQNAGNDSLAAVASLLDVVLLRLTETIPMQSQVVSVEDKIMLEDMQTSLCGVLQAIITRLDSEIISRGDSIMQLLLQLMVARSQVTSSIPEAVFGVISALANAVEGNFAKYMDSFKPFLLSALANQEERGLCSMAIGLVSDITRSIGETSAPYCMDFMNYLMTNLQRPNLSTQLKPAILQAFGDIASAIGGQFEPYMPVVTQVLEQASSFTVGEDSSDDLYEYVLALREGIMDAWGGIISAMKISNKTHILQPSVPSIMQLLSKIYSEPNRSEALMRSAMGIIGDLCDAFPHQELSSLLREEWLTMLIKETRQNRDYSSRTIEVARWAREQVKHQTGAVGVA